MGWTDTAKLDAFLNQEFLVSFESTDEYDEFYADCRAVGLDYHPENLFIPPPRDKLSREPSNVLVYFERGILRWTARVLVNLTSACNGAVLPYADLIMPDEPAPIPDAVLTAMHSAI